MSSIFFHIFAPEGAIDNMTTLFLAPPSRWKITASTNDTMTYICVTRCQCVNYIYRFMVLFYIMIEIDVVNNMETLNVAYVHDSIQF